MRVPFLDMRRVLRSLRTRNYRMFFFGESISSIGTWMQRVGQDWLVLTLTDSSLALGWTLAFQFLPILIFGLWGGTVADRMDKSKLAMWTQGTQAALALGLGLLAAFGVVQVWMVYLLALLLGFVTVLDRPARHGLVSEMVPPHEIINAQSLSTTVHNVGRLVGPAVAGLAIGAFGIATAFLLNALSFVPMVLALSNVDRQALYRSEPVLPEPGQIRQGIVYVWRQPRLRATILLVAVVALFGQNFRVVLPALSVDAFAGGASTYGTLMSVLGFGAVIGGLTSAGWGGTSSGWLTGSCIAFGVFAIFAALAPSIWVVLLLMVPLGSSSIMFNSVARSLLLSDCETSRRGRIVALHGVVFLGSRPIGGPLLGWVVEQWGPRIGLALGGVSALVAGGLVFLWLRAAREVGEDTSEGNQGGVVTDVEALDKLHF